MSEEILRVLIEVTLDFFLELRSGRDIFGFVGEHLCDYEIVDDEDAAKALCLEIAGLLFGKEDEPETKPAKREAMEPAPLPAGPEQTDYPVATAAAAVMNKRIVEKSSERSPEPEEEENDIQIGDSCEAKYFEDGCWYFFLILIL